MAVIYFMLSFIYLCLQDNKCSPHWGGGGKDGVLPSEGSFCEMHAGHPQKKKFAPHPSKMSAMGSCLLCLTSLMPLMAILTRLHMSCMSRAK